MKKKLIEVALPLDTINDASAYDKMPGIGPHPKGMHHWWARLPLPCARAILFASLVDDPSEDPRFVDQPESIQVKERERLFDIVRSLLQKQIHKHPDVFEKAHQEIYRSCDGRLPTVLDPFCGGGSIPLEAQRIGLKSRGSDINPIPVLITKALIDLIPKFATHPPVNPENKLRQPNYSHAYGLAEDIRYYGTSILNDARTRLGHLYPRGSKGENVIAWLWARTIKCPNPACGAKIPLVRSLQLTSKKKNKAWLNPVVDRAHQPPIVTFEVKYGEGEPLEGTIKQRKGARCICCNDPVSFAYIKEEGKAERIGAQLIGIVAESSRSKLYLSPTSSHEEISLEAKPGGVPETDLPEKALGFRVQAYGITKHRDLFTPRQLTALTFFSDLIQAVHQVVMDDWEKAKMQTEKSPPRCHEDDITARSYADAVVTFLAFALDRCVDFNNSLCRWSPSNEKVMNLFGRQAIPMVWDFSEANILADSVGGWSTCVNYVADCVAVTDINTKHIGGVRQCDVANANHDPTSLLVSTDPPYYDNIGYADLSDCFYVWLRRTIGTIYPEIFSTLLVPKTAELIAAPERFGNDSEAAKQHFESGFCEAFSKLKEMLDSRFPLTVYYAFKQADEADNESDSKGKKGTIDLTTGWETMLEAIISSGFQVTGTWPVRASQAWRMRSMGSNALASYIILVCRPRPTDAPKATRRQFLNELKRDLPQALKLLQQGNIAPVDLAQASIGPGMAVFSKYAAVLESDGSPMRVRTALQLINQILDEFLTEQEGEFDGDTRWALTWFEQHQFNDGQYGDAETLSKAKNTSVSGMVEAGILEAKAGKVRLLKREDLKADWKPESDTRMPVWEITQYLIRTLDQDGETGAAELLARLGSKANLARDLAYRLYSLCDRKGWTQEGIAYNSLVTSWPEITRLASSVKHDQSKDQLSLF
jgi:putative DNA methylase